MLWLNFVGLLEFLDLPDPALIMGAGFLVEVHTAFRLTKDVGYDNHGLRLVQIVLSCRDSAGRELATNI